MTPIQQATAFIKLTMRKKSKKRKRKKLALNGVPPLIYTGEKLKQSYTTVKPPLHHASDPHKLTQSPS